MKINGTTLNFQPIREITDLNTLTIDEIGDEHISTSYDTPLREDAFEMDDALKIVLIEQHFREIMLILGLDLTDDSLRGTPHRVAKMYVQERLTVQIAHELMQLLQTEDVAVLVEAKHLCVASRGVNDVNSSTVTAHYSGKFQEENTKQEFLKYLQLGD